MPDTFLHIRMNLPSISNFLFVYTAYSVSFPRPGDKKANHSREYQVLGLCPFFENDIYNYSNKILKWLTFQPQHFNMAAELLFPSL